MRTTFENVLKLSSSIRRTLRPAAEERFFKHAGTRLSRLVDAAAIGQLRPPADPKLSSPMDVLWSEHDKYLEDLRNERRNLAWDQTASWTFHFTAGRLLLRIFSEDAFTKDFIRHFPQFRDYHYQNSTDRPEEIPAKEWRQRRDDWARANDSGAPAETGLTMSLWTPYSGPHLIEFDRVLAAVPAHKDRVLALSHLIQERRFFRENYKRTDEERVDYSEVMKVMRQWSEYRQSREGRKLLAITAREIRGKLPRVITRELSLKKFSAADAGADDLSS